MAIGGINEFVFTPLDSISTSSIFEGDVVNPFLIAATNWRNGFSLLDLRQGLSGLFHLTMNWKVNLSMKINTNFHNMIPQYTQLYWS